MEKVDYGWKIDCHQDWNMDPDQFGVYRKEMPSPKFTHLSKPSPHACLSPVFHSYLFIWLSVSPL